LNRPERSMEIKVAPMLMKDATGRVSQGGRGRVSRTEGKVLFPTVPDHQGGVAIRNYGKATREKKKGGRAGYSFTAM